ncbi:short-chain dehydrogenase [Rhodococcus sp. EPR-157]|uniref:SDR family NAD(P)-dependent oxidoreductase n=1 Tax=Rhodococcus sp. EPR-157 TaxID=1813677 RepID=UPI0007BBBDC4|nr:SDR family NAD(P)-dependent oxidoreductase [Rhodococcus sp. EPR-157]KZF13346.1 short-chain dehydrogenase [Rhodococcus sp. EPR-157]
MLRDGLAGLVTGAAGGIGRGIALVLAAEGADVVVSDLERSREGAEKTVALIEEHGGSASFVACDVTDSLQAENLVAATLDTFGRFDFAVNNAGVAVVKPFADFTDQDYDLVTDVNLRGTFNGMRAQIRQLATTGGGSIVNIASVAGLTAVRDIGIYTATKHGIIGMTKNAAMEYGSHGIRINAVCPNAIRTPLLESAPEEFRDGLLAPQAIKRLGEPEEVGHAVAWLLSSKAAYVTGVTLPVDGGYLTGA